MQDWSNNYERLGFHTRRHQRQLMKGLDKSETVSHRPVAVKRHLVSLQKNMLQRVKSINSLVTSSVSRKLTETI